MPRPPEQLLRLEAFPAGKRMQPACLNVPFERWPMSVTDCRCSNAFEGYE